jgi:hypothetical protein
MSLGGNLSGETVPILTIRPCVGEDGIAASNLAIPEQDDTRSLA